ncbi:MAG: N-acetylmuramoyl-L-alanine amidase [Nocardioides sp.]
MTHDVGMACSGWPEARRRAIVVTLALTLVAAALVLTGRASPEPEETQRGELVLGAERGGVRALDVPLNRRRATVEARGFSMVGLTWRGGPRDVRVRTRAGGTWSLWQPLSLLSDGPDRTAVERRVDLSATDLHWVGRSDAVRVEVDGVRPNDLTLVLLDGGRDPAAASARVRPRPLSREARKPPMLGRNAWRADAALRTGRPSYNRTIQQVHLHHTVNSNDYSMRDVPGLLRGIYRYHTQNLGWSDIGYNFVVDRFGRTWIGRAGGAKKAVLGAHTLGFNSTSTGVAVLGNFERADPGGKVVTALVQLAAWKLHRHHRKPAGRVKVFSHGSDRYPAGRSVWLPAIDGHRDTNQTACPGGRLYRHLDVVRRRAAQRVRRF